MSLHNAPSLDVELCMGSSCYCRGNRALAVDLKTLIEHNGWQERIKLRGCLCRDTCATGPHVAVNDSECGGQNAADALQIISELAVQCTGVATES